MVKSCQILLQEAAGSMRGIPLTGAQKGLVLTMTSQDCLVHWPGSVSGSGDVRLVDEATILPYQKGSMLYDTDASTEIVNNSIGTVTNKGATHARKVFMIRRPPLIPPKAPDVRSSNESESNILPNALEYDGKTESQRQVRERRNKLKQERRRQAQQRKEAWVKYESDIAEYNKKKLEQEAKKGMQLGCTISHMTKFEKHWKNSKPSRNPMKNKNDSGRFSSRQPLEHTTEGPAQDYPPDQHPTYKKIKVKGGAPSKD
jgi:hypothetical protein